MDWLPFLSVIDSHTYFEGIGINLLYALVVRVLGYRSGGPGSIPGTTRKK
jgi:hypothetical protein